MTRKPLGKWALRAGLAALALTLPACGWQGINSLPLPGTEGGGPESFEVQAQLPTVHNIEQNSRVRVGDVTVGNVTKIERQGWHALLTMTLNSDVELPANATATIGQTSLLGTLHVELAPPKDVPPEGKLGDGSMIPLSAGGSYPSTEQTLSAMSMLLNGGGLGQIQDITKAFSTAFSGREEDLRSFIGQMDQFVTDLNVQKDDIIAATDSLNRLVGRFADQQPVLDEALRTIPDALAVLNKERDLFVQAVHQAGEFSALGADLANQSKEALVKELNDFGPVLEALANAGPDLTRSLGHLATFPWPKDTLLNWFRGDYANLTAVFDLTLSRLDTGFFTGTRWEGDLTELEMQWGRTIGQIPSPSTAGNPLVVPYKMDQGP
ncbi:mammalian cell entry protein [Mycolicibacterium chitae]|uniref:Virulence factor Mce family protein n=1 Tax=Mycolicibacterium chitae TaxID=1792 RepID=A0A448IA75_MYCCI|nr:MCE family protein [Mycolicibacterium chitae]MCV7105064.1 MCE family protein [Mycolicibacterium chitae]BBZ05656.1 mammalian cell entry protein [Mycolicibacterium chitae]VEG49267.1 virulence factor Mce family protein [Mycolicibacterium chitae]